MFFFIPDLYLCIIVFCIEAKVEKEEREQYEMVKEGEEERKRDRWKGEILGERLRVNSIAA